MVETNPQNVDESNWNLFTARWNLPTAAKNCGMTQREMKMTFREFLKSHPPVPRSEQLLFMYSYGNLSDRQ